MKKILILLLFTELFSACQVEGDLTKNKTTETIVAPSSQLKFSGNFEPTSGINVSGIAKIYLENELYKLQLVNFSISSGPDLKVYLSKSSSPEKFITLGNLTNATVYEIPNGVNFNEYTYVLIHCQQYNHLFAVAQLIQN